MLKRILSWFSTDSSSSSSSKSFNIYQDYTEEEKQLSLVKMNSLQNMYEDIIQKYREEINKLAQEAKGKSYKEQQIFQNKINNIQTQIYDCAHELNITRLKKELLEDELYINSENEF